MNRIEVRVTARAQQAFMRSKEVLNRRLSEGVLRGAHEVARLARGKVPKVQSALVNSIRAQMIRNPGANEIGAEAVTGVAHAQYVEEGTGPQAGRPRYYPNPDSLMDYLMNTPASRGPLARGKNRQEQQRLDIWFRSRALAMAIYQRGTKATPFMEPARVEGTPRVQRMVREAVRQAERDVFGDGAG